MVRILGRLRVRAKDRVGVRAIDSVMGVTWSEAQSHGQGQGRGQCQGQVKIRFTDIDQD